MSDQKKEPIHKSFGYAFEGIYTCIKKERNMRIHCVMAVFVVIAGIILGISVTEWCICLVLFGLIMALEMVNTAVEAVVDLVTQERKPLAKIAKDTAAGAVLIAAIMSAIIGCIIFVPKGLVFLGIL
ncbi:MAG: diacylglycerol kinase family protein [Eubacteriales bacterium]|nr:diacylglycerol kinase family protein [Eubacteriales bacterium]